MVWALNEAPSDGPLQRLLLIYLANGAPGDLRVTVDAPALAESCGVDPDAVFDALDRMERRHLVTWQSRPTVLYLGADTPLEDPARRAKSRIAESDRHATYVRDGWRCLRCGSGTSLTVDHVIPESLGGLTERSNFQTLCGPCNSWKGTRIGAEYDYRDGGAL